jgi:hypothetical protein
MELLRRISMSRGAAEVELSACAPHTGEMEIGPSLWNTLVSHLITAMREELLCSGELLAMIREQHWRGTPGARCQTRNWEQTLGQRLREIHAAQLERRAWQRLVRRVAQLPETMPFAQVIPWLPAKYQALVASLAQENLKVLHRISMELEPRHWPWGRLLARLPKRLSRSSLRGHAPCVWTRADTETLGEPT